MKTELIITIITILATSPVLIAIINRIAGSKKAILEVREEVDIIKNDMSNLTSDVATSTGETTQFRYETAVIGLRQSNWNIKSGDVNVYRIEEFYAMYNRLQNIKPLDEWDSYLIKETEEVIEIIRRKK